MEAYRLYNVVPALVDFLDELTNWYVRLNRRRFWSETDNDDKRFAYRALYDVLMGSPNSWRHLRPFWRTRFIAICARCKRRRPKTACIGIFLPYNEQLVNLQLKRGYADAAGHLVRAQSAQRTESQSTDAAAFTDRTPSTATRS
jgi:hypothetical protein